MMSKRLLFVVNSPAFFLSHRLPIASGAKQVGYEIHVATGSGSGVSEIKRSGFAYHPVTLSRSGKNPIAEVKALVRLYRLMRKVRPSIVHLVTIKPVLYGGIAARLSRVPSVVSAVSGLGSVFVSQGPAARGMRVVVQALYKQAFAHPNIKAIFQNPDDRAALLAFRAIERERTVLIRGSGVKLADYPFVPEPPEPVVVSFAGRLLREKGIFEYVEAARIIRERGFDACFRVIGDPDPGNPSSVGEDVLGRWRSEGLVELLGFREDIPSLFSSSHVVVLPSYREGLPKSLVEAAAAGRAVVTTDVPGCRDAIEPDKSGLLVPVKDPPALADAIQRLIENPGLRRDLGAAGRILAEKEFGIDKIVDAHLQVYAGLEARAT
ncbi:Glycosyltransferase involved in cell wall bisynthesis [Desulfonatronum thiosulfatophilum]|uniref:Glycosyltransferase involved in cell wall bisynthesis n=1 Tax=Desulfonatronum thiosulfatophilum TaxID=617002 RepID=A0A1G6EAB5_9BACT|nr:glycosyltransferase family 4 protein [Desulfonatronum thiosulfatophilum]SDB54336.1 Glycosyltransferase involved in cell wall bisynthesis [Desulfonatronum thiosulfatophilum]